MLAAQFVLIPLMILFFFVSFGAFEAAGGIDSINKSRNSMVKRILSPLTIERPGIDSFKARILFVPALIAFFVLCASGLSQLMIRDRASQILSTVSAVLTLGVIVVAWLSW